MAAVVLAAALLAPSAHAYAAPDSRELKAREAFAAQRYQDALDLFAKLYAETLHPIYLRNIGRCYQNLGQPDQAITSFREYLRKAKNLPAEETREIEGYIKEMEELKRQQGGERVERRRRRRRRPSAGDAAAVGAPSPAAEQLHRRRGGGHDAAARRARRRVAADLHPLVVLDDGRRGVAAPALGIAFAAGAFTTTEDASCPTARRCP